jgi:acyl-CoA dehydrogenase
MLLATLLVLAVTAAVFAVTQIGALVTLLFVIAVLVLAYKRLPLLAFSIVFSILFVIYTWFGAPGGLWKGLLLLMLVVMWLFNIRPLRKALISRPFLKAYLRMLPTMSDTERDALEAGTVWWDGELFTGKPDWSKLLSARRRRSSRPRSRPSSTAPAKNCAADRRLRHHAPPRRHAPEVWEFLKREGLLRDDHPEAVRRPRVLRLCAFLHAREARRAAASRSGSTVAVPNSLGPRRTAAALRHRGTEEPLPAPPRARRGDPLLRAHRPARRFRRRLDPGHRRRLQGLLAGARDHRPQA